MPKLQREFEGTARVKGVPRRSYNVIFARYNPTALQHTNIIVASFNDRNEADYEANRRNDGDFSNGTGEFSVEENQ